MTAFARALPLLILLAHPAAAEVLHVPKDFATIQAAANVSQPGDEIVVAAGTYVGVVNFDGKLDVRLRGQGKVVLQGDSPLLPVITVSGGAGITIEHLRIEQAPKDGILLDATSNLVVRKVRIEQPAGVGLHVTGCDGVDLEHLTVTGAGEDGLLVEVTDFLTLRKSRFEDGDADGVRILDGVGALVERVRVEGSGGSAFTFGGDTVGAVMRKCLSQGANPYGIFARGNGLLLEENRLLDGLNTGVNVDGLDCIIRRNRILRPAIYGVFISAGTHQVLDNRIVQPGQAGVLVTLAGSQLIAGNRVTKSQLDGLVVGTDANGCTLLDNKVVAPEDEGIEVDADDVQASGNRISGAGGNGLQVFNPGGVFTGNKAKGSAEFDLLDATGGGSVYVDNDFGTTKLE